MAYVSTEFAKKIREQLKKEFPLIKFSVIKRDHSELSVAIMSTKGDIDFTEETKERGYQPVNHYHLKNKTKTKNNTVLQKITDICLADHWNKSEIEIDYFDRAYYFTLSIGKFEKHYCYLGA